MASEIERLDADVRAVVKSGHTSAEMIKSAGDQVLGLIDLVKKAQLPREVDVSRLLRALADADVKIRSAHALVIMANAKAKIYAASHLADGGGSAAASGASTTATPSDRLSSTLADRGMRMAEVSDFDFSDNPITGWDKAPRDDIEWAVSRWDDTLAPGIADGKTRDDFAAMDAASGATGNRQLATAWDYFLGDDAIHGGGPTASGGLDVGGGRHRLQVARDLGIRFLPIRFH